jgi:hypothetical protein
MIDYLPDWLTTTLQSIRHAFSPAYDLPAIPRRRRRHFKLHRLKYTRRLAVGQQAVEVIGGVPSIFELLSPNARYIFCRDFDVGRQIISSVPSNNAAIEFLEFYGLDVYSHWNLDNPQRYNAKLKLTDQFIGKIYEQCLKRQFTFILLVDHGQEPVENSIDLLKHVRNIGLPQEEYLFMIEVPQARFWFNTDRARKAILEMLDSLTHVRVRSFRDLNIYGIRFDDSNFGETYAFTDPGYIFFPHDFYHPLANLYLALRYKEQRPRLSNPRHRGCHGHLPDNPADEGYMILTDQRLVPKVEFMDLIDFAPSVLACFGHPTPNHMKGRIVFE